MPTITQNNHIDITVEKFLNACSGTELHEIDLLIQSPRFRAKMKGFEEGSTIEEVATAIAENPKALRGLKLKGHPDIYYCSICKTHVVDTDNGEYTCQGCLDKEHSEIMSPNYQG